MTVLVYYPGISIAQQDTVESQSPGGTVIETESGAEPGTDTETVEPVFDVDVLVERVKDTGAVGVITKLSLKNQIDDLLEDAEDVKLDPTQEHIEELRSKFEGLLLKTVTLLNNGEDYALAEDIFQAR